jgi:hypothetical protein
VILAVRGGVEVISHTHTHTHTHTHMILSLRGGVDVSVYRVYVRSLSLSVRESECLSLSQ